MRNLNFTYPLLFLQFLVLFMSGPLHLYIVHEATTVYRERSSLQLLKLNDSLRQDLLQLQQRRSENEQFLKPPVHLWQMSPCAFTLHEDQVILMKTIRAH